MAQTILFRGDHGVAMSIEVEQAANGLTITAHYHPATIDDQPTTYAPEDLANAIEDRVEDHFREARSRLRVIRMAHSPAHVTVGDLSRYGVPLLNLDQGRG